MTNDRLIGTDIFDEKKKRWQDKYRKAVDIVLESIISRTEGMQEYEAEWNLMQKLLDENQKILGYTLDKQ